MPLVDKPQEATAKYIAEIALGFVLSGLAAIGFFADLLLPPESLEAIGRIATGRILLGLCLLLLALIAWNIYLRPRLKFVRRVGAFVDKSGVYYCVIGL